MVSQASLIKQRLTEAADEGGPLQVSLEQLVRRVRRRRRVGLSVAVLGASAVVGGALGLTQLAAAPTQGPHPAGGGLAVGSDRVWSQPLSRVDHLRCGSDLAPPGGDYVLRGVRVKIVSALRSASGEPLVSLAFTSQRPVRWQQGPWPPRLLVLRGGTVVARPAMTGTGLVRLPPLSLSPTSPYRVTEPRGWAQLCSSTSWEQIWAHPASYRVVALVDGSGLRAGRSSTSGPDRLLPLLVSDRPLGAAR